MSYIVKNKKCINKKVKRYKRLKDIKRLKGIKRLKVKK
jgi:hypothetical protein